MAIISQESHFMADIPFLEKRFGVSGLEIPNENPTFRFPFPGKLPFNFAQAFAWADRYARVLSHPRVGPEGRCLCFDGSRAP